MFYHEKDARNVVTLVILFIKCSKYHNLSETPYNCMQSYWKFETATTSDVMPSLLESRISSNSEFGCY